MSQAEPTVEIIGIDWLLDDRRDLAVLIEDLVKEGLIVKATAGGKMPQPTGSEEPPAADAPPTAPTGRTRLRPPVTTAPKPRTEKARSRWRRKAPWSERASSAS